MGSTSQFLHDRMLPPLIHAALAHYQFEAIHPFLDGNGRVGRLLITLELCEREVLPAPLLYLSAFFEATRADYYDGLGGVSDKGDWLNWLQYFLNGVARQAEDAVSRAERINALLALWRNKLSGDAGAKAAFRMLDMLGGNPFVTPRGAEKHLGLAYNTRHARHRATGEAQNYQRNQRRETCAGLLRARIIGHSGRTGATFARRKILIAPPRI